MLFFTKLIVIFGYSYSLGIMLTVQRQRLYDDTFQAQDLVATVLAIGGLLLLVVLL